MITSLQNLPLFAGFGLKQIRRSSGSPRVYSSSFCTVCQFIAWYVTGQIASVCDRPCAVLDRQWPFTSGMTGAPQALRRAVLLAAALVLLSHLPLRVAAQGGGSGGLPNCGSPRDTCVCPTTGSCAFPCATCTTTLHQPPSCVCNLDCDKTYSCPTNYYKGGSCYNPPVSCTLTCPRISLFTCATCTSVSRKHPTFV